MADSGGPSATSPFVVYRRHLDVYRKATGAGLSDADYVGLVAEADARVAEVDGTGFRTTPLRQLDVGGGGVLAKIETANVGGSHKARHLFGLLLGLLIDEAVADGTAGSALAIASCGNAAVGAAVLARSAGRRLRVFVPTDADEAIVARLEALGAEINVCPRRPGQDGDPCVAGLDAAIAEGARPFTVQGTICPDVIDGGRTLGLELASQLDDLGISPVAIYIQIGGGALATAVMDGLRRHRPDGPMPRLHPVQALAAHPYVAGWDRIVPEILADLGLDDPGDGPSRAAILGESIDRDRLPAVLEAHRSAMKPWPTTPRSVASGILDDLTYDWPTVMAHQVETGGWPILVAEETFVEAAQLASTLVDPPPDETGAAGLAGYLEAARADPRRLDESDRTVVLLTGVRRPTADRRAASPASRR